MNEGDVTVSEINIKIIKCDSCGELIKGRSDNGSWINHPEVKIKNPLNNIKNLDICYDCWKYYYIPRSKNKKDLFKLIKDEFEFEFDIDIKEDKFYYEYVNWKYLEKWKVD